MLTRKERRASNRGNRTRTAVCLAGALRTFAQPAVQRAFVERVHHRGYEYFVSTDTPRLRQRDLLLAPIRAWVANGVVGELSKGRPHSPWADDLPRGRCPARTCNSHRFVRPMAERLAECYYAMQDEEGRRSLRYHVLLRLRPDHLFLTKLPPVAVAFERQLTSGHVLLYDDQMAIAHRDDAAAVLLTPSIAYDTCADAAQWTRACTAGGQAMPSDWTVAKCSADGYVPCPPMALVVIFGAITRWSELPWRPRSYRPAYAYGDFCIKRDGFVNETTTTCPIEEGCMSC